MAWKVKDKVDVYFMNWKGEFYLEGKGIIVEVIKEVPDYYVVQLEKAKCTLLRTIPYPDSSKLTKEHFNK